MNRFSFHSCLHLLGENKTAFTGKLLLRSSFLLGITSLIVTLQHTKIPSIQSPRDQQRQPGLIPPVSHAYYASIPQSPFPLVRAMGRRKAAIWTLRQFFSVMLVLKRKKETRLLTYPRSHYLAPIDHCASLLLCFFHGLHKHAHCLFGMERSVENIGVPGVPNTDL